MSPTATCPTGTAAADRILWLTAASSALALVAVYVVAVLNSTGQLLDTRVMLAAVATLGDAEWTEALLDAVSPLSVLAAGCLGLAVVVAARGLVVGTRAAATMVGTLFLSEALKVTLVRPSLLDNASNSLPSGHVSAVAAVGVAAYVASQPTARRWILPLSLTAVVGTGLATMAQGWHRPSDVIASAVLAVGVGALATSVTRPVSTYPLPSGVTTHGPP